MFVLSLAGCFLFLAACASPSQSFDPEDPAVVAAIESLMAAAIQAAGDVDPVKVLESMGGGEEFSLVTSDVMLVGLQKVQEAFKDTYDGLERQDHTVFETRVRLLSPDVAVYSAVAEGTYTDLAGWTSEPAGLGLTVVFVREEGHWVGRHVHQSVAF
jgi:uncharacterized protein (TIGR02246 family)